MTGDELMNRRPLVTDRSGLATQCLLVRDTYLAGLYVSCDCTATPTINARGRTSKLMRELWLGVLWRM